MKNEPVQLDPDSVAVLRVLSRGYRRMTADDVAHAYAFTLVSSDRVQSALTTLENAGFVQRSVPPTPEPVVRPFRYGLTPDGRSAAIGLT